MEAVIIGVSDKSLLFRKGRINEDGYQDFLKDYAEFLSENFENVIVTPDDGVYSDVAKEFEKVAGKKPVAFYPDMDKKFGYEHIKKNFPYYEMRPIGGDWYKLNAELVTKAPIVICLGFSPGSMIELSYIKYHQKHGGKNIKLFIDKRCIDKKLPESFEEQIKDIYYYNNLEELKQLIKNQN